ncbi:DUF58 domain-containing protein [Aquabacterium sp. J223]|uniref:DUF58 domain-containing protein n=1 Tax=Aquabacterium sp. J223 TaxID=2898431 RepID=UPI0021ADEF43|nr:DUF58 domain-containing protein [Aquabacterium sp. J223]UUX95775.1 DUF58 domain-containing protein [Aquabacterium sp. J223]
MFRSKRRPEPAPASALPAAAQAEQLLGRLEWTVLKRLSGLLEGEYRTLFRGNGLDLADLREYQLHDDVRHIDWNVTARLQQPHVRQFQQDRELAAWFLVDVSASIDFGSGAQRKQDVLLGFIAVVARLLAGHGNRVGLVVYDRDIEAVLPPKSGRAQVLQLLHLLMNRPERPPPARRRRGEPPPRGTDLAPLLLRAGGLLQRRSLVFLVSDFQSGPGWTEPLGRLAQRHEVLAVRLSDPLERSLPSLGLVLLQDAETGEQTLVDTADKRFRRRFEDAVARREAELQLAFADAGVDAFELATDDDLLLALRRFMALRRLRQRRAGAMRTA